MSPIRTAYLNELNAEIARTSVMPPPTITEEDIAHLPEPVQRFFRHCGYMGRELPLNGFVEYRNVFLKIWEGSNYAPITAYHFDTVLEPGRLVYIYNRIFNFIPLEANSIYSNGEAKTTARLMWIFPPKVPEGQEQNESILADLLGDTFLIPGLALQPYIHWVHINDLTTRAFLRHAGLEVSAIFRFNEAGECIEFDTDDRSYTMKDTSTAKVRSTMLFSDYHEQNGIRIPGTFKSYWHLATGDFEYAKGEYGSIRHNVRVPFTEL